jgi:uncharacterized protein (DUF305 family)
MNAHTQLRSLQLMFARFVFAISAFVLLTTGQVARADAPAPDVATQEYEVRFMQEMTEHHMMAVQMGMMCLDKAVHQELRTMCQDIVTSQQEEIQTMQQWLANWYRVSMTEPRMPPGHENRMEKLSMLSGAEFEIAFMTEMIRHHKKAVVNASQCIDHAYHDALQDLCTDIATTQLEEIRLMEDWLCQWYGMCRPRHGR